ncbi:MAG: ATP-binding protein, partial [Chloroflexaceae bacterium]|nr:ATP-binding protein [Chloroflexaceae bacterium]
RNNTGKTSVLEAIYLYAHRGNPTIMLELLRRRGEISVSNPRRNPRQADLNPDEYGQEMLDDLRAIFYHRPNIREQLAKLQIGSSPAAAQALRIQLGLLPVSRPSARMRRAQMTPPDPDPDTDVIVDDIREYALAVGFAGWERTYPLYILAERDGFLDDPTPLRRCVFLRTAGLSAGIAAEFWDNVALEQEFETYLLDGLRLIEPEIEAIAFVGDLPPAVRSGRRPIIRLGGARIPLGSTGEGMNRLLGILLALLNARDGFLLIDEIEIGLHYTVQVEMWKLILAMAHRLNVQVFATTHSWDCIEAFQHATSASTAAHGQLIRLQRRRSDPSQIQAVTYTPEELQVVTQGDLEVR